MLSTRTYMEHRTCHAKCEAPRPVVGACGCGDTRRCLDTRVRFDMHDGVELAARDRIVTQPSVSVAPTSTLNGVLKVPMIVDEISLAGVREHHHLDRRGRRRHRRRPPGTCRSPSPKDLSDPSPSSARRRSSSAAWRRSSVFCRDTLAGDVVDRDVESAAESLICCQIGFFLEEIDRLDRAPRRARDPQVCVPLYRRCRCSPCRRPASPPRRRPPAPSRSSCRGTHRPSCHRPSSPPSRS